MKIIVKSRPMRRSPSHNAVDGVYALDFVSNLSCQGNIIIPAYGALVFAYNAIWVLCAWTFHLTNIIE